MVSSRCRWLAHGRNTHRTTDNTQTISGGTDGTSFWYHNHHKLRECYDQIQYKKKRKNIKEKKKRKEKLEHQEFAKNCCEITDRLFASAIVQQLKSHDSLWQRHNYRKFT